MEIIKPTFVDIRTTARISSAMKKRLKEKEVDQHRFASALKRVLTNEHGMAGSFTNFLEDELLDHVFGASAYTAPVTLYFLASTTTISDDGTGATEPVGNNYARTPVTNNLTNFPAASSGAKANGTAILWPEATGSWGTLLDIAANDASSGGNMLIYGDITGGGVAVTTNEILRIPVGDLDITLD
jgi:hypothetical protein